MSTHTTYALFTDLYQLTMAQAYYRSGQAKDATFSLFFRRFPTNRAYYVFCGLKTALDYLDSFAFSPDDIASLKERGEFGDEFLDFLRDLRLTCGVRAMDEGQIFFPNEPVMEVSGPLIQCQLVETALINLVNLESMLATKAARVIDPAGDRIVADFSARRTHGMDAAFGMARASYIAGFAGTSNVGAAVRLGIPMLGTMAHSYVSSFDDETEAFRQYATSFPDSSTFLVDTYDTLTGVQNAITVALEMEAAGHSLRAVRLDSGDIDHLSRRARAMLDDAGLPHVQVFASGGLDEYSIDRLLNDGAPIGGFGVGTRAGTSADAPFTDFVYKLVEYDGHPVMKLSEDKVTLPDPKQVFRRYDDSGKMSRDTIHHANEPPPAESRPLLKPVMENGIRTHALPSLDEVRSFHADRMRELPNDLRGVRPSGSYRVDVSETLRALAMEVQGRLGSAAAFTSHNPPNPDSDNNLHPQTNPS